MATHDPVSWYNDQDTPSPKSNKIAVCHAFGCARREVVRFNETDIARMRRILKRGHASPRAERQAISRLVQWFENRVAPAVGSANDIGGLDLQNAGVPGQLDCIDEATNTTSILMIAEQNGLLRHHRVGRPVARGFFLDGRYPHATATVVEKNGEATFAIDSWQRANGRPPVIQPIDLWISRSSASAA